jgi:GTP cyclohydrolase I
MTVDHARIEAAVREILLAVGEDPDRDGLAETPARVARSYAEVFAGLAQDPAEILGVQFDIGFDEMVLVRDIALYSTCEHHLVPFHGAAHIGYIPGAEGRVTGLSKLARSSSTCTRAASSSSWRRSTCACPCAACRNPARRRSRRPSAGSCAMPRPDPRR